MPNTGQLTDQTSMSQLWRLGAWVGAAWAGAGVLSQNPGSVLREEEAREPPREGGALLP